MLRSSVVGVLFACLVLQAAASAVHPELLSFLRPQAAELQDEMPSSTGRRLQQTFDEPNFPFTLDGFGIGTGGMFPGGGAFNGFALSVYNILFRDLLNYRLNDAVASVLPNDIGDLNNFIPPDISERFGFGNDVVALFGYDWLDKYIGQYLTEPSAKLGKWKPAGCVGPTYSLTVDGGKCEKQDDGSVECAKPSIQLQTTPLVCNLPYKTKATLEGKSFQYKHTFGSEHSGDIGLPAGVYNFGAAFNITAPNIGFSAQLNRLANDFGVQQWWQFLGQYALNELLRVQAALLSGAVDGRIIDAQNATAGARSSSPIESSLETVKDAGLKLMNKIATRMGLSQKDLTAGLKAAGVPVEHAPAVPAAPMQQQKPSSKPLDPFSVDDALSEVEKLAPKGPKKYKVVKEVTKETEGNAELVAKLQEPQNGATKKASKPK